MARESPGKPAAIAESEFQCGERESDLLTGACPVTQSVCSRLPALNQGSHTFSAVFLTVKERRPTILALFFWMLPAITGRLKGKNGTEYNKHCLGSGKGQRAHRGDSEKNWPGTGINYPPSGEQNQPPRVPARSIRSR